MKQTIEKLTSLEHDITSEKGDLSLFGLFLHEDANNKWDLLVSAPWLAPDTRESLDYIANHLRARLNTQELLSLSAIIILKQDNPVLEAIHNEVRVRHGMAEVRDEIFAGVPIKRAYIITSERDTSTKNRLPQPA